MARRPQGETRARVLELAIERFGANGYRHTALADIARTLGVSAPAIHAHFATKQALFDAALTADVEPLVDSLIDLLGTRPGVDGWIQALPRVMDEVDSHPLVRRVLTNREPEAFARLAERPELLQLRGRLRERIEVAQQRQLVRSDVDADTLAAGMETLLVSLVLAGVQTGLVGTDPTRARGIAAILERGVSIPRADRQVG